MLVVLLFLIAAWVSRLAFHPAFGWALMGRQRHWVEAGFLPDLFPPIFPRLSRRLNRSVVSLFAGLVVFAFAVWTCLSAALKNEELSRLETQFDVEGVCLQSTDYTCGPAATVTLGRRMGIGAGEGELARLTLTSPAAGTPPDVLADGLRKRYGADGIQVNSKPFRGPEELRTALPALVLAKYSMLTDHWIAVLGVDEAGFRVADPLIGLTILSNEQLETRWQGTIRRLLDRPQHGNAP